MNSEQKLTADIVESGQTGESVRTKLTTNERVLARITDGIYRLPASALRELISNAYDADARQVVIITDAPRFSSITVRDDGSGLTPASLAHMIKNIGGSAKRTEEGKALKITSQDDTDRSPGGRQLIGKLGIGLFAVAQFTRHFLISTKTKGDNFRTIADITLGGIDGEQRLLKMDSKKDADIETGDALIYQEAVGDQDVESHGTEIKLLNLLPRTRAELSSADLWAKLDFEMETEGKHLSRVPSLHIGRIDQADPSNLVIQPEIPWNETAKPAAKFKAIVEAVRDSADVDKDLVNLEAVCDRYFQTLWTLALSAPLPYIDGHPFDLTGADDAVFFHFENKLKGQAKQLELAPKHSLRSKLRLLSPDTKPKDSFSVEFDGIRLSRPISFRNQPVTTTAVKTPLLAIGKCRENFENKPVELSRGPLEFEAYLFWTPKVLPTQHQGVLIRVGNATGTIFDATFMGYQISEQTRLRQITAEIFVSEGFDGAINLDRESYNFAHPHYQFLVKWLHSALRQLTNKHKEIGNVLRTERDATQGEITRAALETLTIQRLKERGIEDLPEVILLPPDKLGEAAAHRKAGRVVISKEVVNALSPEKRNTRAAKERIALAEKKAIAFAQVLSAWGVLEGLSFDERDKLIQDLVEVALFE